MLKSRNNLLHRVNTGGGADFELIDQIDEIKKTIRDAMSFFVFERDDFERLLLTEDSDIKEDRKNTNLYPDPGSVPSNPKKRFFNNIVPIKTGPSIKWADVKITFISDEEILVQHGGEREHRKFKHAGFEDGRDGKPIGPWAVFREAALSGGHIPFNFDNRRDVEKIAQALNKKLKFPVFQSGGHQDGHRAHS